MILLDSNLLVRMTDSMDPQCAAARRAFHVLLARRELLIIVPQNLYEFWAVATRPAGKNGLGMTSKQASLWVPFFQRRFQLVPDHVDLVDQWHNLVKMHSITGLKSHDARLVAAMHTHGISQILTFNANDFKGFPITVIDPATV